MTGKPTSRASMNPRIDANSGELIDRAAALLGKTRAEFILESAVRRAMEVALDQRIFVLDSDICDRFVHALENPPPPGPKLKALMRRVPIWQRQGSTFRR